MKSKTELSRYRSRGLGRHRHYAASVGDQQHDLLLVVGPQRARLRQEQAISHGGRRGRRGWGDFGKELVVAWPMMRWPRRPPHNPRLPPPVLRRPTSRRPPATRESG
ncbi:Os08g0300450 [Oryza sativa Japonica Group]|uniref:Os08g0300450 protein n=1 Tax=Oryza sativa subsp. japonica TaxID=39947 RepID=Q6ZDB9_ORYSJ|nr:hypothetical protein [Oryza sativa Japonica Group]BAH94236.1 Os08g0300450 [Oryza sativa Japonica Group]|eukprot:NP_001175508.1 Os08g0300450 [Oryza sativa Japonica Group]